MEKKPYKEKYITLNNEQKEKVLECFEETLNFLLTDYGGYVPVNKVEDVEPKCVMDYLKDDKDGQLLDMISISLFPYLIQGASMRDYYYYFNQIINSYIAQEN